MMMTLIEYPVWFQVEPPQFQLFYLNVAFRNCLDTIMHLYYENTIANLIVYQCILLCLYNKETYKRQWQG